MLKFNDYKHVFYCRSRTCGIMTEPVGWAERDLVIGHFVNQLF